MARLRLPVSLLLGCWLVSSAAGEGRAPATGSLSEYVAAKDHEFEQDLISETHLVRLRREMKRLQQRCPVANIAELEEATDSREE